MLSWRYRRVLQAEAAALAGSVQPAQAGNTADDELDELKHVAFREERGLVGSSILAGSTKRLLKAFECLAELRQKVKCEGPNWERDRNTIELLFGTSNDYEKVPSSWRPPCEKAAHAQDANLDVEGEERKRVWAMVDRLCHLCFFPAIAFNSEQRAGPIAPGRFWPAPVVAPSAC